MTFEEIEEANELQEKIRKAQKIIKQKIRLMTTHTYGKPEDLVLVQEVLNILVRSYENKNGSFQGSKRCG